MRTIIITNNPRVNAEFFAVPERKPVDPEVDYREGATQEEILIIARDLIHLGARLVIHPMMGRIRPNETPYKSVFIEIPEENETRDTDFMSVMIIEDSILETRKFLNDTYMIKYEDDVLEELQYMDYLLMKSGIEERR